MGALVFALLLTACVNANSPLERRYEPVQELKLFRAGANTATEAEENSIEEINIRSRVASKLYQGDILLTEEQKDQIADQISEARTKRQAFNVEGKWKARKWENGVAYMLGQYLDDATKTAFRNAAALWMENTCINFTEYEFPKPKGLPKDYLFVYGGKMEGCTSFVGRQIDPGFQPLTLGQGCETFGHAAHEIGHALGLFHTHTRYDRNNFITVHMENIKSDWREQFDPQTTETNENYDLTYDYGSIMHYAAKSIVSVKEDQLVMEAIDGNYTEAMGSDIISFYDFLMVNKLYNCNDVCENKLQCHNDGYPNPRNCSTCVCPSGYGGPLCEKRPEGCGGEVDAKEEWQTLEYKLDSDNANEEKDGFRRCIHWIKAPNDTNVEVEIVALPDLDQVDHGCKHAGVEIKAHSDKRLTGYRFCSKADVNKNLVSNSSLVPVITYSRMNSSVNTKLRYRHV